MQYKLIPPWNNETWTDNDMSPYSRLAGKRLLGGSVDGSIGVSWTDIPRGVSLIVTGTTVVANRTPSQDDLSNADAYYLGGHIYYLDEAAGQILIDAGYGSYLEEIP